MNVTDIEQQLKSYYALNKANSLWPLLLKITHTCLSPRLSSWSWFKVSSLNVRGASLDRILNNCVATLYHCNTANILSLISGRFVKRGCKDAGENHKYLLHISQFCYQLELLWCSKGPISKFVLNILKFIQKSIIPKYKHTTFKLCTDLLI